MHFYVKRHLMEKNDYVYRNAYTTVMRYGSLMIVQRPSLTVSLVKHCVRMKGKICQHQVQRKRWHESTKISHLNHWNALTQLDYVHFGVWLSWHCWPLPKAIKTVTFPWTGMSTGSHAYYLEKFVQLDCHFHLIISNYYTANEIYIKNRRINGKYLIGTTAVWIAIAHHQWHFLLNFLKFNAFYRVDQYFDWERAIKTRGELCKVLLHELLPCFEP